MVIRISDAALVCILTLCASLSHAEPFGLKMGVSSSDVRTVKDEGAPNGMFRFLDVGKPHPDYTTYIGQFSEKQGLCWVKAIGKDMPSEASGTQVKAGFDTERERLTELYGIVKNFDFRFSGRSDDDLDNWLQAVSEGDRYVAAIWDRANGAVLPDSLDSVGLVVNAYNKSMGYLSLEYTFKNIGLCEKELTQAK